MAAVQKQLVVTHAVERAGGRSQWRHYDFVELFSIVT